MAGAACRQTQRELRANASQPARNEMRPGKTQRGTRPAKLRRALQPNRVPALAAARDLVLRAGIVDLREQCGRRFVQALGRVKIEQSYAQAGRFERHAAAQSPKQGLRRGRRFAGRDGLAAARYEPEAVRKRKPGFQQSLHRAQWPLAGGFQVIAVRIRDVYRGFAGGELPRVVAWPRCAADIPARFEPLPEPVAKTLGIGKEEILRALGFARIAGEEQRLVEQRGGRSPQRKRGCIGETALAERFDPRRLVQERVRFAVRETPPPLGEAEGYFHPWPRLRAFDQEQDAARREQALRMAEGDGQIARGMDDVGGDYKIEATEPLFHGRLLQ